MAYEPQCFFGPSFILIRPLPRRSLVFTSIPTPSRTMTSSTTSKPKLAILDDYQGISLSLANWDAVKERVGAIDVYRDTLHDQDAIAERLESYEIICAMRERTKFTKQVLERLPNLKFVHLCLQPRCGPLTSLHQIHRIHRHLQ